MNLADYKYIIIKKKSGMLLASTHIGRTDG